MNVYPTIYNVLATQNALNGNDTSFGKAKLGKLYIGRVQAITTTENTPTPNLYKEYNAKPGLIFYSKIEDIENTDDIINDPKELETKVKKGQIYSDLPLLPNHQQYPLTGEMVILFLLPNNGLPKSEIEASSTISAYYIPVNFYNNTQDNSIFKINQQKIQGKYFKDTSFFTLRFFEGDFLLQGRGNNSLRFSNSWGFLNNQNYWTKAKSDGDPIVILRNGTPELDPDPSVLYVEDINKDNSSIVLTSTQTIPLNTTITTSNFLTKTILPNVYSEGSQIILNSDRLVFNTKQDDILLYSKTNTEIYAGNFLSLNVFNPDADILLNSNKIILGQNNNDKSYPTQPAILGNTLEDILLELIDALGSFGNDMVKAISTPQGTNLIGINVAGRKLTDKVLSIQNRVKNIKSNVVYIKDNIK
jgi:hypothetical protein